MENMIEKADDRRRCNSSGRDAVGLETRSRSFDLGDPWRPRVRVTCPSCDKSVSVYGVGRRDLYVTEYRISTHYVRRSA